MAFVVNESPRVLVGKGEGTSVRDTGPDPSPFRDATACRRGVACARGGRVEGAALGRAAHTGTRIVA